MRTSLLAVLLALVLAGPVLAAEGSAGSQPFAFLNLDPSARAAALGGAMVSAVEGPDAMGYNPAGLALTRQHEVSLMHEALFAGAAREHAALAFKQGFGASVDYLSFGRVSRTTLSRPDGGLGSFAIRDMSAAAGWGFNAGPLSLGAAGKLIREQNDDVVASALAADAGAVYRVPGTGLRLGAALQNVGTKVRFQSERESLPVTGRGGVSLHFEALGRRNLLAADAVKAGSDKLRVNGGVETEGDGFSFRFGYTTRLDAGIGLTAGVGLVGPRWRFDYAIAPYGDLGLTHRLSVALRWGEVRDPDEPEREDREEEPRARAPAEAVSAPVAPDDPLALLAQARVELAAAKLSAVEALLARAARAMPPGDKLRVRLRVREGELDFARRRYEDAAESFMSAISQAAALGAGGTDVAAAYHGLSLTRAAQGDYDEASRAMRKAHSIEGSSERRRLIDAFEDKIPVQR